ncbi:Uncharacterised protein [Streptococcus pneumoniae]|nr:Uncharacterised protein [Streptococcus pneumoniae]CJV96673.1 Uncharacterised protein [Streptococcus pneumoniae]
MPKIPIIAISPVTGPISSLIISPRDLPLRLIEANKMTKSCTAPATTTPTIIHIVPGKYPICAAKIGPTKGPAPAIAAK